MSAQPEALTSYRRMLTGDLADVVPLEHAVHSHPWTQGNFADSLEAGYHCWIIERGRDLAGYGVVSVAAGEAHLLNITISPEWQRMGYGGELTEFLLKLARDYGATRIYLEVRPSNTAARRLYARSGFTEIAVRRAYYPAPDGREDAIVMERSLK
jgi:[ribosomal protein S18]-alanine N-acetyltransferase